MRVIGRAGIGLDNVDIPAATKRGIIVMNTPGGNVVTTAEHAVAMMLALSRNIPQGTASLKGGRWEKKNLQGREIYNKVLGIIGFGRIGQEVNHGVLIVGWDDTLGTAGVWIPRTRRASWAANASRI